MSFERQIGGVKTQNMIDTHAHVFSDKFDGQESAMLDRARAAGIERIYMPNIDIGSVDKMMAMAGEYPGFLWPMLGLHPCYVGEDYEEHLRGIEQALSQHEVIAIGETGLDFYWDTSFVKQQKESLSRHMDWAIHGSLPIVLHSRSAIDTTIEMMRTEGKGEISGVFHCFTGTIEQAFRIIDLGFKLGIGGIVTFKNAGLDQVVQKIPLDAMVLETDSPYLAPHPHRSKTNEPAFLPLVAEKIAELHEVSLTEVIERTTMNAQNLFRVKI